MIEIDFSSLVNAVKAYLNSETEQMPDNLSWALFYAACGMPVFPLKPGTKDGFYRDDQHRGKPSASFPEGNPYSWQAQATTDPERIKKYWTGHPDANIGGATGNGLYILDIDKDGDQHGFTSINRWTAEGILPGPVNRKTWTTITGREGVQMFYRMDEKMLQMAKQHGITYPGDSSMVELGSHVDTRGEGRFVVLPPSLHPNGRRYSWTGNNPATTEPAAFDRTVEFLFTHKAPKAKRRKADPVSRGPGLVPHGSRRDYMISQAGRLVCKMADQFPDEAIVAALMQIASSDLDPDPPFSFEELKQDMQKAVCDFRSKLNTGDQPDWSFCVAAWKDANHTEQLPDPVPWDDVKAAGMIAKAEEKTFSIKQRKGGNGSAHERNTIEEYYRAFVEC